MLIQTNPPDLELTTRPPAPLELKPPVARRQPAGLIISLALHALLVAALVAHGEQLWSRTPDPGLRGLAGSAGSDGGGGGPRVSYITLPSVPEEKPAPPKTTPALPPPRPVAAPAVTRAEPPKVTPPPTAPAETASAASALASRDSATGSGPGTGGGNTGVGAGPGRGPGTGPGAGTGGGGEGGKARPPEPRDMAFPFDNPPKELRGLSLNVTFWVRPDGRVERYLVEPEIKDRDYAKKFDEVMRAFRFTPARAPDGTSIPGTTRISFTLPGKSSS
jgi:hypothetical protein